MKPDDLAGRHPRIDAATALEHQPDARPMVASGPPGVDAQDPDVAAIRPAVALDDLDGRRLAGPIGAEEGEDLAAADLEGEPAKDCPTVVALAKTVDLDRRGGPAGDGRHDPPEIRPY